MDHQYLFVGGLHRSGTSLFRDLMAAHPNISGLERTGVIQDEGQFLQKVYRQDRKLGGPGRFAFHAGAHITEDSKLVSEASRRKLVASWSPYWDLTCPILMDKTPSNMLKSRFLQAIFPDSTFIIVVRHPVPTTLATIKWHKRKIATIDLLDHWFAAHDILRMDSLYVRRLRVVRYEELMARPGEVLADVAKLLRIEPAFGPVEQVDRSRADRYRIEWDRICESEPGVMARYEHKANRYGYTLEDPAAIIGNFPIEASGSQRMTG